MNYLIHLDEEWDGDEWGASTCFDYVPTEDISDLNVYDVKVCPYVPGYWAYCGCAKCRCRETACYSLVWKLILHPKIIGQDMKHLASWRKLLWPEKETLTVLHKISRQW